MIVYLCAGALAAVLTLILGISKIQPGSRRGLLNYLPILPIVLVSAFRYGIGRDYLLVYEPLFYRIADGATLAEVQAEPGYYLINWLVSSQGGTFVAVAAIMSVLFGYFMCRFILDRSAMPALSFFLLAVTGVFPISLNLMRQMVAVAIVMYALKFIARKNLVSYCVWLGLAASIHFSAIIFLPLYWVVGRRYPRYVSVLAVIGVVVLISFPELLRSLIELVYEQYLGSYWDFQDFALTSFILAFGVALWARMMENRLIERFPADLDVANIAYINAILMSASMNLITPDRIFYSLYPVVLVLVPNIIAVTRSRFHRQLLASMASILLFVGFARDVLFGADGMTISQYVFIFG